jgi:hypothetical protein
MKAFEIGRKGEERALEILKKLNYENIVHLAKVKYPYRFDISCSKEGNDYMVEVKTSMSNKDYFPQNRLRIRDIQNSDINLLVILVNKDRFSLFIYNKILDKFDIIHSEGTPELFIKNTCESSQASHLDKSYMEISITKKSKGSMITRIVSEIIENNEDKELSEDEIKNKVNILLEKINKNKELMGK